MRRPAATLVALSLALAGCGSKEPEQQQAQNAANSAQVLQGTEPGVTPMNKRVAIIAVLNKRNGIVHNLKMTPGQSVRVGDAVVRLRACETTAPWESEKLTGAFLQLDVEGSDKKWRRAFSGWVYKESPSLNVVQHPVYDVWPKSCAMTFPPGPPPPSAPASSSSRSSAQKSPGPDSEAGAATSPESAAPSSPSAAASNAE